MTRTILHENPEQPSEFVPQSVRELDALLNHRVKAAATAGSQNDWMRLKVSIKRHLAYLPASVIDDTAAAILTEIGVADDAAGFR